MTIWDSMLKKKNLKMPIILLIVLLLVVLTMTALSILNPIFFWVLAGMSAVFAFGILPKMKE